MKISSGVTSYVYDLNRDAAQKRRFDDVTSTPQQSRLVDDKAIKAKEKSATLVETVVEGEVLNQSPYDLQSDETLRYSQVSQSAEAGFVENNERMGFKTAHALEQYRAHFISDEFSQNSLQGRQIDLYV